MVSEYVEKNLVKYIGVLHHTTLHTAPHCTTLHHTTLHTAPHCTTLHLYCRTEIGLM